MSVLTETPKDNLIPISASTLFRGSTCGIDVFTRAKQTDAPVLFCAAGQTIDKPKLDAISENCKLYIHGDDRNLYQSHLRENYQEFVNDGSVAVVERVTILNDVIRDILANQFATGSTESIVENCQSLGKSSASLLGNAALIPKELCSVLHHDFGTFTHSANVSAYAVVLGRGLGYSEADLEKIAVGALLHDLGKLDISDQILNKPGKLTDAEYSIIKQHPTTGLQRLGHRTDLTYGQLMMIYQHHERVAGGGYPVGCADDEIHPWGKICAVVDVFEALTSNRPYRVPFSHATAFAVLQKGCGTEFDKGMLECWRQLLSL